MSESLEIYIDGASRGNPGEAAIGIVFFESVPMASNRKIVKEIAKLIGRATNNVAEYSSLVCALQEALILQAKRVRINTDSELLYYQVLGHYGVKNQNLKVLFDQVQELADRFDRVEFNLIPREENAQADRLANSAFKTPKKSVKITEAGKN